MGREGRRGEDKARQEETKGKRRGEKRMPFAAINFKEVFECCVTYLFLQIFALSTDGALAQ